MGSMCIDDIQNTPLAEVSAQAEIPRSKQADKNTHSIFFITDASQTSFVSIIYHNFIRLSIPAKKLCQTVYSIRSAEKTVLAPTVFAISLKEKFSTLIILNIILEQVKKILPLLHYVAFL